MSVKINKKFVSQFVSQHELDYAAPAAEAALSLVKSKNGPGNDFLGWVDLPVAYDKEEFARIKAAAERIKKMCDVLVVIGIAFAFFAYAIVRIRNRTVKEYLNVTVD